MTVFRVSNIFNHLAWFWRILTVVLTSFIELSSNRIFTCFWLFQHVFDSENILTSLTYFLYPFDSWTILKYLSNYQPGIGKVKYRLSFWQGVETELARNRPERTQHRFFAFKAANAIFQALCSPWFVVWVLIHLTDTLHSYRVLSYDIPHWGNIYTLSVFLENNGLAYNTTVSDTMGKQFCYHLYIRVVGRALKSQKGAW